MVCSSSRASRLLGKVRARIPPGQLRQRLGNETKVGRFRYTLAAWEGNAVAPCGLLWCSSCHHGQNIIASPRGQNLQRAHGAPIGRFQTDRERERNARLARLRRRCGSLPPHHLLARVPAATALCLRAGSSFSFARKSIESILDMCYTCSRLSWP